MPWYSSIFRPLLWKGVETALVKHFFEPDFKVARVLYSSIAAHYLSGQPVWCMLVAPSGSMKTDLLESLDGLPNVRLIDGITENTFLSGQIKDKPSKKRSSSLLHRIGTSGFIVIPDFSTVLGMNINKRKAILADLRRIYDGKLAKEYGTDEEPVFNEWTGRITLATAATDSIDRHHEEMQELGERWLMNRWGRGGIGAALAAMRQDRQAVKKDLRDAVHTLFSGIDIFEPIISEEMLIAIAALAEFGARARLHIPRDSRSRAVKLLPDPESSTRLAQQLTQLVKGSALILEHDEVDDTDFELAIKCAFDCMPRMRRMVLDSAIYGFTYDAPTTSALHYANEELNIVGLLKGNDLSTLSRNLLAQAGVLS